MIRRISKIATLTLITLYCFSATAGDPASFANETLNYVISYKWGLIEKNAANATLKLINNSDTYEIQLSASTLSWVDKIYSVRDTLQSQISRSTLKPIKYIKITHEKGKYKKDVLTYSYDGNNVTGTCQRIKISDGKTKKSVDKATVTGTTYDMLSIFYYIRTLDFGNMPSGKTIKVNILSGSSPEIITIKNLGVENTKMPGGRTFNCYHIQFTFTSHNGKKVSNPMDTWITTDNQRLPVKLIGNLPFGKIRAFLSSSKP